MNAFTSVALPISAAPSNFLMDLPALWAMFRRRFRIFLGTAMAVLTLVVLITFQMTPKYDATARVVLNARETQALDVSAVISGMSPDAAIVDTEAELIKSRVIANKVAEKLNLFVEPEFNTLLKEKKGFLSFLFPAQLEVADPANDRLIRERTIDQLLKFVEVERSGITYAIEITATSEDPLMAADIANAFADQYIVDQLDQKFETYNLVNSYLAGAVEKKRIELRKAEAAVENYRAANGLFSVRGTLLSEQQISDLQAQLVLQEANLAERQAKLTTVNRRLSLGAGPEAITDVLTSQVIGALRAKQADLTRRQADLETRYGPKHPLMDKIKSEADDIKRQINEEMNRIVAGLANEVEVAEQRVLSLRSSINELRNGLSTDNQAQVKLRELEREADLLRKNYQQLLERSQQAVLFEDLAEADARVADPASIPTRAAFPNFFLNLALAIFMGGVFGGLMVALAEVFDNGIRTAEDVERTLSSSLMALVPQLDPSKLGEGIETPQDYIVEKPLSAFAESYRSLRNSLALSGAGPSASKVITLTSAVSGEGKTVSTLCLGRIAALSGDRVIIIDCDVRRRTLSAHFDGKEHDLYRLNGVLSGEVPLRTAVIKDEKTDLHILPVLQDRSGLGDQFGSGRFQAFLSQLRTKYDLILLDTPPLTAVADARLIAQAADRVVQVVRWKSTPANVAQSARKILDEVKTPVAGALLTQVDMRAQAGYGYEGSYRYYAQHGKYYFD